MHAFVSVPNPKVLYSFSYMSKIMTLDEKIRYGMIALGGASIVLTVLGAHVSPFAIAGGSGG